MPRPTSLIRVADFLGEDDATPATLGDASASTLENGYKQRRSIIRRKGQSALGTASLSPDQDLNLLEWAKFGTNERLVGVHAGDVVDFFADPVGTIVGNGADRLPTNVDADGAWINGVLVIGNGTDANVRYNGASGVNNPYAVDLEASSSQALIRTPNPWLPFGTVDLGFTGWVKPESLGSNMTVASIWDTTTVSQMAFYVMWNAAVSRFEFAVMNGAGPAPVRHDAALVIAPGNWYHLLAWFDSAAQTMNIRVSTQSAMGVTQTSGSSGTTINGATTAFYVGARFNGAAVDFWDGLIDNVGLSITSAGGGAAFSGAVQTSLWNSGNGKPWERLSASEQALFTTKAGYWNLDETSGTRADSAGTNESLTEVGTPGTAVGVGHALTVVRVMPSNPSGSFTAADSGAGGNPDGTYTYKVAFLSGDSNPTEALATSNSVTVTTNQVNLTSIPTPTAGQDATGRRIYRNKATNPALWYFLADISDTTTTTYTDNIADTALGAELVEGKTTMPPLQFLVEHQDRLFGSGNADNPQVVYISDVDDYMYYRASPDFDQSTYDPNQGTSLTLQGRAAGKVTGLCPHGDMVAAFTAGAGFFIQGDQPQNFRHQRFTDVGCVAHRTIKSYKSLLLWLGADGVYAYNGQGVERVSDDQRVTIEAMTADEMSKAHAFVWENRYYLCWPTGCIYVDLQYRKPDGGFLSATKTNWLWRTSTVSIYTSTNRERIYASKYGNARVYQLESGATDAIPSAGTAIPFVWEGKDNDMGYSGREKRVHYVDVRTKKGTGTLTVTLKTGTGKTVQTISHDISTVDDASETVSRMFTSAVEQARSEFFRVRVAYSGTAAEFELISVALHYSLAT